ncbi:MAG: hypothetical protein AAGJ37_03235 [Pseudomonadota bacterium]
MKVLLSTLLLVLLTGCQNLPSPNETNDANYGIYPDQYEGIAKNYLKTELRDPESVEFRGITEPRKHWIGDKVTGIKYGYLVCVDVNSKNVFGKMTGYRTDAVLIRDGDVIKHVRGGELISGMRLCN